MSFEPMAERYDQSLGQLHQRQREQVWLWLDHYFCPGMRVLDLGGGTGADAHHLTGRGVAVHLVDPAPTMVEVALQKVSPRHLFSAEVLGAEALVQITDRFEGCYSNFSPLNCVADIPALAQQLARILKPNAPLILVIFGRYCLWEMFGYIFKGQLQRAFRRWQKGGVAVPITPTQIVTTYYHSVQGLRSAFAPWFDYISTAGIGVAVPPTYFERTMGHQSFIPTCQSFDLHYGAAWPYSHLGDHILLVWQRKTL